MKDIFSHHTEDRGMKRIAIASLLLLLGLTFNFSGAQEGVKRVQVTAQVIANQPPGKPYVLDLSRNGTIYEVSADVDLNRLRVRTSQSEVPINEFNRGASGTSRSFLGRASDLRQEILEPGARKAAPGGSKTAGFVNCAAGKKPDCHCVGWRDCIGLAVTKVGCDYWSCSFPEDFGEPVPYCTCSGPAK
jgi:hypothetical protein